ncbi:MAG TPA: ABC transporter ATP-binding protein [Anaerolineaceae bacterium]
MKRIRGWLQRFKALRPRRTLALLWRICPGWTALSLLLVIGQGVLPLLGLYAMKRIFDAAVTQEGLQTALVWAGVAAGAALLTALLRAAASYVQQALSQQLTDAVSDILHERSVAVDLAYYEQPAYYDTLHRAQQEAPHRPAAMFGYLVQIVQSAISLIGVAALLIVFHWVIGLLLFFVALPGMAVRMIFSRRQYAFEVRQAAHEREAAYYHNLITDSGPATEVRLFGLGDVFRSRFRALRAALRKGRLRLVRRHALFDLATQVLAIGATFGIFAYSVAQAARGQLSLGSLVIVYLGFQSGLGYLQSLLHGLAGLFESNLFLTHFYQFLDLKNQVQAPVDPLPVPRPFRRGVELQGVSFRYPGSDRDSLRGVDLTLKPGEVIALVGENGAGKTTLIKLLCRLYDPAAGCVRVDGIDLRQVDPAEWRRQIAVVLQDYMCYFFSAEENIWLGDVSAPPDEERIRAAARLSGAEEAVERLSGSFRSILGKLFEGGMELSTGEWQKLALARAFYRKAEIVVLDEPTSSLDPLAEAELFQQFRRLIAGRSAIVISHRFSTVQMADRIYVLESGQVVECGTHAELLARGGHYARLYMAQAQYYQQG